MTPEEQALVFRLAASTAHGPQITREDFKARVGINEPTEWALLQLEDAIRRRDSDDAEAALLVSGFFGFDRRWIPIYQELLQSDWHHLHEDAAETLGQFRDPSSVPSLVHAAHHVPEYLEYDEARSLASKAIHSLGKIPGPEAEAALHALLLTHEDRPLRETVQRVLDRRRANPPPAFQPEFIPPVAGTGSA